MADPAKAFRFERYCLVPDRRALLADGDEISVRSRAFDLLLALVERRERVVSKNELMELVWPERVVEEGNLTVHIASLRKLLGKRVIATLPNRGYRFVAPVEEVAASESANTGAERVSAGAAQPEAAPSGGTALDARPRPLNGLLERAGEFSATNLPEATSELIGRDRVLADVLELIAAHRIVTLTGPGGIGKTRVALEAARQLLPMFADGVWLAELAPLTNEELIPDTVAAVLGIEFAGPAPSIARIAKALGSKQVLLVLDNCEHVIDGAAAAAEAVVRANPNCRVLATSREPLRVEGEWTYPVRPLEVPAADTQDLSDWRHRGAVGLFFARALAVDPSFSPDAPRMALVGAVCRRLDGIPLAIELAAARAATLGLAEVAGRLDDRFNVLTGGRRTALPRQQTLRATLDWSYNLLSEPERHLLCELAVFAGGFTLEAATAVTSDGDHPLGVADGIKSLVAKSLVILDPSASSGRWQLLETIRAYAYGKLTESGEAEHAARRHAEFYRDLFASTSRALKLQLSAEALRRHVREMDNVRAALDWSFSPVGDAAVGVVLTAAYAPVWQLFGLIGECRECTERALERLGPDLDLSAPLRMQLYLELGFALHITMGSMERTKTVSATALALAEDLDDSHAVLKILYVLWAVDFVGGDCRAAQLTAERFLDAARRTGEPVDLLVGERLMGNTLQYRGKQPDAQRCLERVLELYVAPENQRHTALFQYDQRVLAGAMLARVLWLRGFADQAVDQAHASLEEAQARHELSLWSTVHHGVYPVELETGDLGRAEQALAILIDLAMRFSAPLWKTIGHFLKGKLLIRRGEFMSGLALVRAGLETCEKTGWMIGQPEYLGALAEGLAGLGQLTESVRALEQALTAADRSGERWYVAELLRFKGELLLRESGDFSAGEDCIKTALGVAREQDALSWELRAAMSLARLRVRQDRADEARHVLAPVYERFTEGFGTADLRAARAMLETLPAQRVAAAR